MFLEDISDLDAIVSPVSGGGLISGILCFAKQLRSNIKVYGAEPSEADDAYRSIKEGKIVSNKSTNTICDGLRAQIGTITFPIVSSMCDGILRVDEDEIIESMKMIWDRMKIIASIKLTKDYKHWKNAIESDHHKKAREDSGIYFLEYRYQ